MKNFFIILSLVVLMNCTLFSANSAFAEIPEFSGEDLYKYYVLDRIDGPDIPSYVTKFANENNCFSIMKCYHWSRKIFKDKGGVYSCNRNGRVQYVYDNQKKLRFARWYEKFKFRKQIFEN